MHFLLHLHLIKNHRYAISVVIEHGGTGSSSSSSTCKKSNKKSFGQTSTKKKISTRFVSRGLKNDKATF